MRVIHHWKSLGKEITDGEHQFDQTYSHEIMPSQTLDLKHVEIIKFSDERTYGTSLESS